MAAVRATAPPRSGRARPRRSLELTSPAVSTLLESTGQYLHFRGLETQARELAEQVLAMRQRLYQSDHPDVVHNLKDLAADLIPLGRVPRASALFWEALKMRRRLRKREAASRN